MEHMSARRSAALTRVISLPLSRRGSSSFHGCCGCVRGNGNEPWKEFNVAATDDMKFGPGGGW